MARIELGHTYLVSGQVVYGKGLGSFIGFPTLNVFLCDKNCRFPVNGVYAVKVFGVLDFPLLGVANIGHCPTIHRFSKPRLEVHLLDCEINLYGFYIEVVICAKIRDEQIFSSIIDLKDQIQHDISNVRKYFNDL